MFRIGESLREARTRRGLSPADVHKAIRIRERYLTALEEERWDMLPGEAYARGFLRTYAEFLGLDGNLYLDEYNARIRPGAEEPLVVPQATRRERRVSLTPAKWAVIVVAIVAIVAGLAASRLGGSSTPQHRAQPPAAKKQIASVAAPAVPHRAAPRRLRPAVAVLSAARGRCWVLVRSGGPYGAVIWQGVLEQGQAKRFSLRQPVWIRMGAPSMLDLRVGGRLVPGLLDVPENLLVTRSGARAA